jgi:ABC-type transporter Mla MlaB component
MTTRRKAGSARGKKAAPRKMAAASRVRAAAPARASSKVRVAAKGRTSAAGGARFPADFTIAQADDVKAQLARMLAKPATVTLDLSPIRRIDTAGLQVLTAFIRERRAAGRAVECAGANDAFRVTAQMLGVGAFFDAATAVQA